MTAQDRNPPSDPLTFRLFNEIGIIEQLANTQFARVLPHGLTLSQFGVLNHLVRLGGTPNLVDLARSFQVTKGAMTNTVRRLLDRQFVDVSPDPQDRRGKLVSLTPAGRAAREDAVSALYPKLAELAAEFSDSDIEQVLPFLRRLRAFLDSHR